MSAQYWQEFLIPYHQAVDELVLKFRNLKTQAMGLGENSPIETVQGRVKTISSILEKVNKYGINVEKMETCIRDIAGIRIICHFVDDIYEVANMIKERDGKDLKIVEVKNYMAGKDRSQLASGEGNPKESGYQSYHIIISYPVFCATGYKEVFVEIQIRTLAMNFWSVIEHSLNYKYKDNLPDGIRERLQNTASAVTQLDAEMSEIRDEIQTAQRLFKIKSSTVNTILEYIDNLYKLNQTEKAADFEKRFEALSDEEDLVQLFVLKKELSAEITRIEEES